jgi:transcriptional regulator with XRE-family HTH domain
MSIDKHGPRDDASEKGPNGASRTRVPGVTKEPRASRRATKPAAVVSVALNKKHSPPSLPQAAVGIAPSVQHRTFGEKLRSHRESRSLSLKELASQAGISVGILSQVERGINSPSLRTLSKVRTALGLPSSFFFDDDHPPRPATGEADFVCRIQDRPQLDLGPGAPRKELLHHGSSRVFEFMTIDMPPHSQSGTSSYPSEKGGYLLEGEVVLTVGKKAATLRPGDSFLFDGTSPHDLRNPTDQPAKVLWIIAKLPNDLLL